MNYETLKRYRIKLSPTDSPELEVVVRVDERDLSNAHGVYVPIIYWDRVEHVLRSLFGLSDELLTTHKLSLMSGETVDLTVDGLHTSLVQAGFIQG